MKLSVSTHIIDKWEDGSPVAFKDAIEFARNAGFEVFDMSLDTTFYLHEGWQRELDERADMAAKAGIPIKTMHLPYNYPRSGSAEEWDNFNKASFRAIDQVKRIGAACAAIHPRSYMTSQYDADEEYQAAYEFLRPFCEYAQQKGVKLAIEVMRGAGRSAPAHVRRFGTDVNDLIRLADDLGEGICWDTGHANISMQNQYKSLKKIGSRLRMIHVNDNFAEDDIHLAPFLGNVDWQGFVRGLKEIGYPGDMNLEVSCKRMPLPMWKPYGELMAESGRRLIRMFQEA